MSPDEVGPQGRSSSSLRSSRRRAGARIPAPRASVEKNRWLLGFSILAVVVHLVGLYEPGSPDSVPLFDLPGADKVAHFLLFAFPVWLLGRLTGRIWLIVGIFALHGVVSELIQYWFLPHRSGDPLDFLADLIGVAAGTVLLLVRRRCEPRPGVAP